MCIDIVETCPSHDSGKVLSFQSFISLPKPSAQGELLWSPFHTFEKTSPLQSLGQFSSKHVEPSVKEGLKIYTK